MLHIAETAHPSPQDLQALIKRYPLILTIPKRQVHVLCITRC